MTNKCAAEPPATQYDLTVLTKHFSFPLSLLRHPHSHCSRSRSHSSIAKLLDTLPPFSSVDPAAMFFEATRDELGRVVDMAYESKTGQVVRSLSSDGAVYEVIWARGKPERNVNERCCCQSIVGFAACDGTSELRETHKSDSTKSARMQSMELTRRSKSILKFDGIESVNTPSAAQASTVSSERDAREHLREVGSSRCETTR